MAMKHPEKVGDLLAYSSLIVNVSRSYEGTPWLDYDNHFRHSNAASGSRSRPLSEVDSSTWTLHFSSTTARQVCKYCFEPGHRVCKMKERTESVIRPRESARGSRFRAQPYTRPPQRKGRVKQITSACYLTAVLDATWRSQQGGLADCDMSAQGERHQVTQLVAVPTSPSTVTHPIDSRASSRASSLVCKKYNTVVAVAQYI